MKQIVYTFLLGLGFLAFGLLTLLVYDPETFESVSFLGIWWSTFVRITYVPIVATILIGVWWIILAGIDLIKLLRR